MREFLDDILEFIGEATLSNDEWAFLDDLSDESLTNENYTALLAILDAREMVSNARDRLRYYFLAAGVELAEVSAGKSNILVGGTLCS